MRRLPEDNFRAEDFRGAGDFSEFHAAQKRRRDARATGSSELANMSFKEAPGVLSNRFFPTRVIGCQPWPKRGRVRFVKGHALRGKFGAKFVIEGAQFGPLQANEFNGVALDDSLHVGRQALP